jgi:cyclopropane-fatty-acyl-phospholipid synthase
MSNSQMHTESALASGAHSRAPGADADMSQRNVARYRGDAQASKLLARLFHHYPGCLNVRLWNGTSLRLGRGNCAEDPGFSLVFRTPEAVWSAVLGRDPLALADAFFRGDLDIEGDFFAALGLKDHLGALKLTFAEKLQAAFTALHLRLLNSASRAEEGLFALSHAPKIKAHSKAENREAIHYHYDVSNDFYALWLDRAMVYSCAYFETPATDLDTAQQAKLEHICRKLSLQPGEEFLDIGCGWGALVIYAARHFGVRARGVTLSPQQLKVARERIAEAGLAGRVSVDLMDYRDLPAEPLYDKIASVGMFEHVGLKNLPVYFATVHRLLKPRGLFLNHGITHEAEGWEPSVSTEFINRYVFPDGQLDTISNIQRVMERSKFEIADVEALRPHYAMTLRRWVARLEDNRERALEHVNEATYRVWRLYMTACALQFESGEIGIYQVLANKRAVGAADLPLTRRHLYCS